MLGSEEQEVTESCSNQRIFAQKTQPTASRATKGSREMEVGAQGSVTSTILRPPLCPLPQSAFSEYDPSSESATF